jgi:hypothetical protein
MKYDDHQQYRNLEHESSLDIQNDTANASIKPNKLPEILCLGSVLFQKQIQTS